MQSVFRIIVLMFALCAGALNVTIATARATEPNAMERVVEAQLNAFAADRGDEAYSYAAPVVQMAFPSIDRFMAMVKGGYRPVYRNTAREFLESGADSLGRPTVRVRLTGTDGKRYEAIYGMEQQADGSWKIASCVIMEIAELGA